MNGCGYNSIATVAVHINNLIARGHLRKRGNSARSLELTQASVAATQPATIVTDKPVSAEAHIGGGDWLAAQVDALLGQAEAAAGVPAQVVGDIGTLLASLRILGLDEAAAAFQPRLQAIAIRNDSPHE
jgi:hypothetical protein